jgi:hypothetical protein
MDFTGFGWRDVFFLALALAAVYLVVALLGLARLRRRREPSLTDTPTEPLAPTFEPSIQAKESDTDYAAAELVAMDFSPAPAAPFAAHLALTELEAEVKHLRADVSALREELAELKAARRISPLYADAAALARRGFDARGVASECGISVAEAELVMAMSRDDRDFDSEVDDGEPGRRAAAGSPGQ